MYRKGVRKMGRDYSKIIFRDYNKLRDSLRSNGEGKLISLIQKEEFYGKIYEKYIRNILKKNGVNKGADILEIGCNLGGNSSSAQRRI